MEKEITGDRGYSIQQLKIDNWINKNYNYLKVILFVLCLLPGIFIGIAILKYSVNFPFLDQWVVAPYIYRYVNYFNIPFQDLIAQHNESRYFFPRLVFVGLAYLTKWDVRYEMLITLCLACIISFNLYRLNKLTWGSSGLKGLIILVISNLLIFSPTQYENWLWGIQPIVFIPMLCITTSILVCFSQLNARIKFIICICLATLSTFSYANGMLSWVVIIPVLAFHTWKELKKEKWLALVWLSAFIFNLYIYFHDYKKPPQHPGIVESVSAIDVAHYFFCFLGSAFAFTKLTVAAIVGIALLITFIAVCAYLLRFRKDYTLWYSAIGWLSIAFYTLISGAITSFGRVGFGVAQAMSPRYTTFSLYLPIALIPLVLIIIEHSRQQGYLLKQRQIFTGTSLVLLIVLLYLHTTSASIAVKMMNDWRVNRLQGKACLMFINVLNEEKCINEQVFPNLVAVKDLANKIDSIGFLSPPLINGNKIQDMQWVIEGNTQAYGWIDALNKVSKNEYLASGWAVLPERKEKADAVILTYKNSQNEDKIFALSDTFVIRQDVAKFTKEKTYSNSGWQKSFLANKLPKGKLEINAWAFDTNSGKAYKLNGSQIIQNQ